MKNKLNFWIVVLAMAIAGLCGYVENIYGQTWTYNTDNRWYIINSSKTGTDYNYTSSDITVFFPNVDNILINYEFTRNGSDDVYYFVKENDSEIKGLTKTNTGTDKGSVASTVKNNTTVIVYGWSRPSWNWNSKSKTVKVYSYVPVHLDFFRTTASVSSTSTTYGSSDTCHINFKSFFLGSNTISVTKKTDTYGSFSYVLGSSVVPATNQCASPYGTGSGTGTTTLYKGENFYLTFKFEPTTATPESQSATFEVTLNGKTYELTINGTASKASSSISSGSDAARTFTYDGTEPQDFPRNKITVRGTIANGQGVKTSDNAAITNALTFTSGNAAVTVNSDNTINVLQGDAAGNDNDLTVNLTANFAGNNDYKSSSATIPITIKKAASTITVKSATIDVNADAGTKDLTVGNASTDDIQCNYYDSSDGELMSGTTITASANNTACVTNVAKAAGKLTLTIAGAEEDDADYKDVTLTVGYPGSHYLKKATDQTVTIRIKKLAATVTLSADETVLAKGGNSTLTIATDPSAAKSTYKTTAYNKNANVIISGSTATFDSVGLFDIQACLSKSKIYKDACSGNVHFQVNFADFGTTTLGSTSASQVCTIDDSRFTGAFSVTISPTTDFQISADGSDWTQATLNFTAAEAAKTFYVRFAPTTGIASGSSDMTKSATITVGTGANAQTFAVTGTMQWPEKSFSQTVGLAKNDSIDISITSGSTITVGSNLDYFASIDKTDWSKSLTLNSAANKLYIKYQPSDAKRINGYIAIAKDGVERKIHVVGTATDQAGTLNNVYALRGVCYGPGSGSWYRFKDGIYENKQLVKNSYDGLALQYPVTVTITQNNGTNDFMLNDFTGGPFDKNSIIISAPAAGKDAGFRVGYFPTSATTSDQTCHVSFTDNTGTSYSFTVTANGKERILDAGTVYIGQSSGYLQMIMEYFRAFETDGATIKSEDFLFCNTNGTSPWSDSITVHNGGSKNFFYVKCVPTTATSGNVTNALYIVDNSNPARKYKYNIKYTANESRLTLNANIGEVSDVGSFTMDNFTPDSTIYVEAPDSFKVSLDGTDWYSHVLIDEATSQKTFYVRMEPRQLVQTYTDTVWMTDHSTGRRYPLILDGVVAKTSVTLSTDATVLTYYSNDRTVHSVVGSKVYASNAIANEYIQLTSSDATKVEVVDGNKLRVVSGITENTSVTITASIRENDKVTCDGTVTFDVDVKYVNASSSSDLVWKKDNNVWYILQTNYSTDDEGGREEEHTVYMPTSRSSSGTFTYNFVACEQGILDPGYPKIDMFVLYGPDYSSDLVSNLGTFKKEDKSGTYTIQTFPSSSSIKVGWTETEYQSGLIYYGHDCDKGYTLKVMVPEHYDAKENSTKSVVFESTEVGEVSYVDVPLTDMFTSFLTSSNGLKIAAKSDNPDGVFFFDNADLVPGNEVISPYNELSGSSAGLIKDANNCYYLRLYFKPLAATDYEGTFYLQDNSSTKFTITVNGKGKVTATEPQTIVWGQDLSRLTAGTEIELTASSSSGLSITRYEITPSTGKGTLRSETLNNLTKWYYTPASSDGSAKITAICDGGSNNEIAYTSTELERDVVFYANVPSATVCCLGMTTATTSWTYSKTSSGGIDIAPSEDDEGSSDDDHNDPITYSPNCTPTKLSFTLNLTNCYNVTMNIYLKGTDDSNIIGTYHQAGSYEIDLSGMGVKSGDNFYCSFSGDRQNSGAGTYSYAVTNFNVSNPLIWNDVIAPTEVIFDDQRIGQAGTTKKITVAEYSGYSGDYSARIEGTDADCFTFVGSNKFTATCDASGSESFDVRFIPTNIKSDGTYLTASLIVKDLDGNETTVVLKGKAVKRAIDVKWEYANDVRSINAVGVADSTTLTLKTTDNAFAYDSLRGEYAKTTCKINYTIDYSSSDIQRLSTDADKQAIIDTTLDANGNITKIQATGYGSGTVYIIASPIVTGNTLFNEIADADKDTLTIVVKKVEAILEMVTVAPSDGERHYGDIDSITSVVAKLKYGGLELRDYKDNALYGYKNGITLTASNCSIPTAANRDSLICFTTVTTTGNPVTVTANLNADAVVKSSVTQPYEFSVEKTGQKILIGYLSKYTVNKAKDGTDSIGRQYTRTTSPAKIIKLENYFIAYDTRHSKMQGCNSIPTYLSYKQDSIIKSTTITLSDYDLEDSLFHSNCQGNTVVELYDSVKNNVHYPYIRLIGETSGMIKIKIPEGSLSNSDNYYETEEDSRTLKFRVDKVSPTLLLIKDGDTVKTAATKNAKDTTYLFYGDNVQLGVYAYYKTYYFAKDDAATFSFTLNKGQTVVINGNQISATGGIGLTRLNVIQNSTCRANKTTNTYYYFSVNKAPRVVDWHSDTTVTSIKTSAFENIRLSAYTKFTNNHDVTKTIAKTEQGSATYSIEQGGDFVEVAVVGSDTVVRIKHNITTLTNETTVVVKATFSGATNFRDTVGTWSFKLVPDKIKISLADEGSTITLSDLTSTTKDYGLIDTLLSRNHIEVNYPTNECEFTLTSGDNDIATFDSEGLLTAFKKTESGTPLQVTITATEKVTGTSDTKTVNLAIARGTLEFNNQERGGKWTADTCWSRPDIITKYGTADYNVLVTDSCFIGGDSATVTKEDSLQYHRVDAECHKLTIRDNGKARLVIGEVSTLNVKDTLNSENAERFVLTANHWGQASVVFGNGSPKATVEMFVPKGNGSKSNPIWQYRGIAVSASDFTATDGPWNCMAIYEWKESDNDDLKHGCWNLVTNSGNTAANIKLSPWVGYAFANMSTSTDSTWLSYTGTLLRGDKEYTLTKTPADNGKTYANLGVNLITNSFAAPMTIDEGSFTNTNATVTFFNAGTYNDWKKEQGKTAAQYIHGDAGQMTVCPQITSGTAQYTYTIPSGQSFFVTATASSNSKVAFTYAGVKAHLAPSSRMFMPREQDEEPEYNVLGIRVAKDSTKGDRLVLIECDSCTRQYDNGYDGYKMKGNDSLPQLYAYNKFGITAVNADSTFNKQYIGFTAGSDDETYTISFETDRLFGYHSLYLTDRKLNQTVDILAGETYQFQGYTVGENMRFQINGITEEEWENNDDDNEDENDGNECDLRVVNNTLYVQGFTTYDYPATDIQLFDMTGNLVWSTPLTSARVYDLPDLPHGIYMIRLGDCHVKLTSMK